MVRILVIDDSDLVRQLLRDMLGEAGYEVEEAPDGATGLELYRKNPADLIITDLLMPGMDGFEVFRKIKNVHPAVRVIMLSGHMDHSAVMKGEAMGVAKYILKPCEFSVLLEAIRNASRLSAN